MRYGIFTAVMGALALISLPGLSPLPVDEVRLAAAVDDRLIAFSYSPLSLQGQQQLLTIRPDGTGRRRLVPGYVYDFAWSPDGRKLAFTRETCSPDGLCERTLYLVDPDGSGEAALTTEGHIGRFDWSPESDRIVFASYDRAAATYTLRIATVGQQGSELLTDAPGLTDLHLSWSPDGSTIAYVAMGPSSPDIFTIDVATRVARNLTDDVYSDAEPEWSPDGLWIAFATSRDEIAYAQSDSRFRDDLYVMRPDGSDATRISRQDRTTKNEIVWKPGSSRLAWQEECDQNNCYTDGDVWTGRVGGRARNVTDDTRFFDDGPDWSPDGRRLVFFRFLRTSARTDLYTIRVDGTGLRRVTDTSGPEYYPDFRP